MLMEQRFRLGSLLLLCGSQRIKLNYFAGLCYVIPRPQDLTSIFLNIELYPKGACLSTVKLDADVACLTRCLSQALRRNEGTHST